MGSATSSMPLARPAVPVGKTRICVSGFGMSHHTGRAAAIARAIVATYPKRYESWFYFSNFNFKTWLPTLFKDLSVEDGKQFSHHKKSPFCWLEMADGTRKGIGGRDRLCEWTLETFKNDSDDAAEKIKSQCKEEPGLSEVFFSHEPGTSATTATTITDEEK